MKKRIKVLMIENGFNQLKLSQELGITRTTFNLKLNGKRKFTQDELVKMAHILNVEITKLNGVANE